MSSENSAIRVHGLSKCYQIYNNPHDRLKQFVVPRLQRFTGTSRTQYYREFWALKDVSFEITKGETVGIIGRNGSGKSTLLQLICGTLTPTIGTVETRGRIAALLELGSGFNPEFTGRENVYLNAAVLGMRTEEVDERFDEIAAFADIGQFIEQPVKTYSSGMFVRLAFAVNILSNPEIMVVDEALAVGDMNFQAKCMTALSRIQERGVTVLFVSHDIGALKSLCSRGIYLDRGTVRTIGKAPDVAELYIRTMREEMNAECRKYVRVSSEFATERTLAGKETVKSPGKSGGVFKRSEEFDKRVAIHRYGSGGARVAYVELLDMDEDPIQSVEFNQKVKIRIYCEVNEEMELSVNFQVFDEKRNNIAAAGFVAAGQELLLARKNECYAVTYTLNMPLRDGAYTIQTTVVQPIVGNHRPEFIDAIPEAFTFRVNEREPTRIWSAVYLFPQLVIEKVDEC